MTNFMIPFDQLTNRVFSILANINNSTALPTLNNQLHAFLNAPTRKNRSVAEATASAIVAAALTESGGYRFLATLPTSVTIVYLYDGALLLNIVLDPILCKPEVVVGTGPSASYPINYINWVNENAAQINSVPVTFGDSWVTQSVGKTDPNLQLLSYVTPSAALTAFYEYL